jgi:hypothetical protein
MMTTCSRKGCRARHGHALALAARQRLHRLRHGADAHLQVGHAGHAFFEHLLLVEHAQHAAQEAGAAQLAAQEQVLGNRHGRGHGQVLVHGFDAGAARVDRALELDALAVEQDLAFVGHGGARQRLDQAGLARAVVADHGQDFAGAQFKVGAVQRGDLAVALDQALGLHDQRFAFVGVVVCVELVMINALLCARVGRWPRPGSRGCR